MVCNITESDLWYDNRQRMAPERLNRQTVTWLTSAATDEWVKEGKGCERGVCAAECDDREGKGNGQNECRENETDRWRKWDRQHRGVTRRRRSYGGLSNADRTQMNWRRCGTHISPLREIEMEKNRYCLQYWPLHADCLRLSQFLFPGFIELGNDLFWFLNTRGKVWRKHNQCNVIITISSAVVTVCLAQWQ